MYNCTAMASENYSFPISYLLLFLLSNFCAIFVYTDGLMIIGRLFVLDMVPRRLRNRNRTRH